MCNEQVAAITDGLIEHPSVIQPTSVPKTLHNLPIFRLARSRQRQRQLHGYQELWKLRVISFYIYTHIYT